MVKPHVFRVNEEFRGNRPASAIPDAPREFMAVLSNSDSSDNSKADSFEKIVVVRGAGIGV